MEPVSRYIRQHHLGLIAIFIALSGTAVATGVSNREGAQSAAKKVKRGPAGPQGPQGLPGSGGSPDTSQQVLAKLLGADGSGSTLDADTLDALDSSAFQRQGVRVDDTESTSPSVAGVSYIQLNYSSPVNVIRLSDGVPGQVVTIIGNSANVTVCDCVSFGLRGPWQGNGDDTLTVRQEFVQPGNPTNNIWREVSRSTNTLDADTLDGIDSGAFVQGSATDFARGDGRLVARDFATTQGTSQILVSLPNQSAATTIGSVRAECVAAGGGVRFHYHASAFLPQHVWVETTSALSAFDLANVNDTTPQTPAANAERAIFQIGGGNYVATVVVFGAAGGGNCRFTGQATINYSTPP